MSEKRVGELLDLATEEFLTHGYTDTSIAEIARLGNASKTTFYSRYPTKEELFLAVIERRMSQVFEQVALFPQAATLEKTLAQFGENLLRIALSEKQLSLVRIINGEALRHPELARRYFEIGPQRGEEALANYLDECIKSGQLRKVKPLEMARFYINLLSGNPIRWFVMGFDPRPITDEDARKQVRKVVKIFLQVFGTGPQSELRPGMS